MPRLFHPYRKVPLINLFKAISKINRNADPDTFDHNLKCIVAFLCKRDCEEALISDLSSLGKSPVSQMSIRFLIVRYVEVIGQRDYR